MRDGGRKGKEREESPVREREKKKEGMVVRRRGWRDGQRKWRGGEMEGSGSQTDGRD